MFGIVFIGFGFLVDIGKIWVFIEVLWLIWLVLGRLVKIGVLVFWIIVICMLVGIVVEWLFLFIVFIVNCKEKKIILEIYIELLYWWIFFLIVDVFYFIEKLDDIFVYYFNF